jgi:hypothetical protein
MRILMLIFLMFSGIACNIQVDSNRDSSGSHDTTINFSQKVDLGEPPHESELQMHPNAQSEDYLVFGTKVNANDGSGITSRGFFCAKSGKVTEFRCGLGNPGDDWVPQPSGCYHILTGANCDCSAGSNWWDESTKTCDGSTLNIVDSCGYEKVVTNWPECTGSVDGFINAHSREEVVNAYHSRYKRSTPDMSWDGDIGECNPGSSSIDYQQRVIDHINYYRGMVGIGAVTLTPDSGPHTNGSALMSRNNSLTHYPPDTWACYEEMAPFASGSSNIALGASGTYAIDLYIDDPGANNGAVGHRRWLLHPGKTTYATGDVPSSRSGGRSYRASNHVGVFFGGSQSTVVDHVTWPNAGYVPYDILPNGSNRWSFSKSGAGFSEATVRVINMTDDIEYDVELEGLRSGYGLNTLVFKPIGFSYRKPTEDKVIKVLIENVRVSGEYKDYLYLVKVIDPNS